MSSFQCEKASKTAFEEFLLERSKNSFSVTETVTPGCWQTILRERM